jgi:hypothetical protein
LFTKKVWERIKYTQNLKRNSEGKTLSDCFNNWIKEKIVSPTLATIICWFIWNERNISTFENVAPSFHFLITKVLGLHKLQPSTQSFVPIRECMVLHSDGFSIAFLDGATHSDKKLCGAGGVIRTFDSLIYR